MGYRTLAACVADLERHGQLIRVTEEVDPCLDMAAIQRRSFRAKAPALLFTRVKGCAFPMLANLFGTRERIRFLFRDTLAQVEQLFRLKRDPFLALKAPWRCLGLPRALWHMLPRVVEQGSILEQRTRIGALPQLISWPGDGGAFVTLPLVYTEDPDKPGFMGSNLGMYRVQLSGGEYIPDQEIGLHYQLHRGIGIHHAKALRTGQPLRVNIFVGGPPALTPSAVMPLPEGLPELLFAGMLAGFRIPFVRPAGGLPVPADADFCISATLLPECKPEGPFGDHLGYYSLQHMFPALRVEQVWHRQGAIWPFTSVGRPPQEDTVFGEFIHELTAPLVSQVFPGVREVHAVDAAGVHPLLLALGSERYAAYEARQPRELLTQALNVLGSTQTSLAKFLLIAAQEDDSTLTTHDIPAFFRHMLERTDFTRDLHFITKTTIDTLDYTGTALNEGSKLIWAAAGPRKRRLARALPAGLALPDGFRSPVMPFPGILLLEGPQHTAARGAQDPRLETLAQALGRWPGRTEVPLALVVDDAAFAGKNWENFLWIAFTRANPATDSYGAGAQTCCKHWGCEGPLLLDARLKSFQAPPLQDDPAVEQRVNALAAPGASLHGWW